MEKYIETRKFAVAILTQYIHIILYSKHRNKMNELITHFNQDNDCMRISDLVILAKRFFRACGMFFLHVLDGIYGELEAFSADVTLITVTSPMHATFVLTSIPGND